MESWEETDSIEGINDYSTNMQPTWKDDDENSDFDIKQTVLPHTDARTQMENMPMKQNNNIPLSELEQQVEDAEVKYDSLTLQLQYMRMMYQDKFDQNESEYEKTSDDEELLTSPTPNSLPNHMDSLELIKPVEGDFQKQMLEPQVLSSLDSDTIILHPSAASNIDFVKEFNSMYKKSTENKSEEQLDVARENENCISANLNMEPSYTCSQKNDFNDDSEMNDTLFPKMLDFQTPSLITKLLENSDDSTSDIINKLSLHDKNNVNDVDAVDDVISNKEEINPVKAIKGILNGITDSVSIISQLSVHASEPGRKEHIKRHRSHRHGGSSRSSKKHVLQSIKSSQVLHNLPEGQTLEVKNKEDMKNSILTETAYSEAKYSMHQKNHHHHHHHRHGSPRCHHNHHSSSMSCVERICSPDQELQQIDSDCSMDAIYESHCSKQNNKSKEHRHKVEPRNNSKQIMDLLSQKSYSDVTKQNMKKKFNPPTVVDEQTIAFGNTTLNLHQRNKKLRNETGDNFSSVTHFTKKHRRRRNVRSLIPTEEVEGGIQYVTHKRNNSATNLYKNDSLQRQQSTEGFKKSSDVSSSHSTSRNTHKSLNFVRADRNKQMSYVKFEKHPDDNPTADESIAKQTNGSYTCSHCTHESNFATPTLSSKLKQVEKPILQLFNFRNIPFVVGTSTTRSHNLGLNLQQALSIIKLRKTSLSVGEDLNTEVGSSVIGHQIRPSTSGSLTSHKNFCPLALAQMKNTKYQQLEYSNPKYAIHDEKNEKIVISNGESTPGTFSSLLKSHIEGENIEGISFPHIMKKENVWDIEQLNNATKNFQMSLHCTCFPTRACTDYQKLLYEYLSNGKETQFLHMILPTNDKKEIQPSTNPSRTKSGISELLQHQSKLNFNKDVEFGIEGGADPVYGQIHAHSKELKEVLMNMHRDFMQMNEKYEQLQSELPCSRVDGIATIKELEKLESELEAKEDDIVIIMGLYKELTSLKKQVRALRMKSSQNVMTKSVTSQNVLPREPTVSVRLTRLLRTIQKFQEKLLHD